MENKAFEIISSSLEGYLKGQGIIPQSKSVQDKTALYLGNDKAVKVTYDAQTKSFILETAPVEEGEPKEWTQAALWLFDPAQHNERDAKTIATDFEDTLRELYGKKSRQPAARQSKEPDKKQKGGGNNPAGLVSRLMGEFPQLKEPLDAHTRFYGEVLHDTFLKENFLPLLLDLLKDKKGEKKAKKVFSLLEERYLAGDKETQSLITMTILASIDKDSEEGKRASGYMPQNLKTAWRYALKYGLKKLNK